MQSTETTTSTRIDESSHKRSKTWERRIEAAKAKHRPKLKNWAKDGFGGRRNKEFQELVAMPVGFVDCRVKDDLLLPQTLCTSPDTNTIYRLAYKDLSYDTFVDRFEKPAIPVIISGVPEHEHWDAVHKWTFENLRPYRDRLMKVGEDDDGYKVKMKLKHFLKYVRNGCQADDSPLYIFDSNFDTDPVSKALLDDYRPPQKYFPDDLFALVGEKRRPPYRWFLVGPERSGTTVHIDPLGTSAWNTVLQGRKRWVLFPPGTPKDTVKCLSVIRKGEDDEAVNYFVDLLPRLKRSAHPPAGMIEFTQMPGDTVFIPGGWWHAVLNLDDTIAVTQNFCSRVAFDRVWRKTRSGRRKMAIKWRKLLKQDYPELVQWSERIDEEDEFNITLRPEKKHKKEA